jgi:membrane associated rhomboid family serine protease
MILFLNVMIYFFITMQFEIWPTQQIREKLQDENFQRAVYEMYIQTLDPIELAHSRGFDNVGLVFSKALKDEKFWNRVSEFPFRGDVVQIEEVRSTIKSFYSSYQKSAQFQFGLGSFEISPWSWLTYQFVHASFIHLLGNAVVIFLVMSFLELSVSSLWLGAVYLFSGFAGGIFFLLVDNVGSMSVVGASASASGLLSFLIITHHSRVMPWFFFLAPVKNGLGRVYLPVFFVFPLFLVSDFVSLLWEPSGVSANVAVSAHVGGALTGLAAGGLFLFFRSKSASHGVFSHDDGLHELS